MSFIIRTFYLWTESTDETGGGRQVVQIIVFDSLLHLSLYVVYSFYMQAIY